MGVILLILNEDFVNELFFLFRVNLLIKSQANSVQNPFFKLFNFF